MMQPRESEALSVISTESLMRFPLLNSLDSLMAFDVQVALP